MAALSPGWLLVWAGALVTGATVWQAQEASRSQEASSQRRETVDRLALEMGSMLRAGEIWATRIGADGKKNGQIEATMTVTSLKDAMPTVTGVGLQVTLPWTVVNGAVTLPPRAEDGVAVGGWTLSVECRDDCVAALPAAVGPADLVEAALRQGRNDPGIGWTIGAWVSNPNRTPPAGYGGTVPLAGGARASGSRWPVWARMERNPESDPRQAIYRSVSGAVDEVCSLVPTVFKDPEDKGLGNIEYDYFLRGGSKKTRRGENVCPDPEPACPASYSNGDGLTWWRTTIFQNSPETPNLFAWSKDNYWTKVASDCWRDDQETRQVAACPAGYQGDVTQQRTVRRWSEGKGDEVQVDWHAAGSDCWRDDIEKRTTVCVAPKTGSLAEERTVRLWSDGRAEQVMVGWHTVAGVCVDKPPSIGTLTPNPDGGTLTPNPDGESNPSSKACQIGSNTRYWHHGTTQISYNGLTFNADIYKTTSSGASNLESRPYIIDWNGRRGALSTNQKGHGEVFPLSPGMRLGNVAVPLPVALCNDGEIIVFFYWKTPNSCLAFAPPVRSLQAIWVDFGESPMFFIGENYQRYKCTGLGGWVPDPIATQSYFDDIVTFIYKTPTFIYE